jgi:hypothetical protein
VSKCDIPVGNFPVVLMGEDGNRSAKNFLSSIMEGLRVIPHVIHPYNIGKRLFVEMIRGV